MDPASAAPAAGPAGIPAAPRTPASSPPSADRSRIAALLRAGSVPQRKPLAAPAHTVPRLSSLRLQPSSAEGYLVPDFYSGAAGLPGRFTEGFSLRRLHSRHAQSTRHACRLLFTQKSAVSLTIVGKLMRSWWLKLTDLMA